VLFAAAAGAADSPHTTVVVSPPGAASDDDAFDARVETLEGQVDDLKEKVLRTKARLLLLQETVLGGDLSSGAQAVIVQDNEMGAAFQLESVTYALDGAPVFAKLDEKGDLAGSHELQIFSGRIVPGQHQLAVKLVYKGHGFGVFSYLEGYKFKLISSYAFSVEPGKRTTLKVVGYDKGGITTALKDRPAIRYETKVGIEEKPAQVTDTSATLPSTEGAAPTPAK
jgi:hypothetical protein